MSERPINLAVVGYGYWGPNIVRNVMDRSELDLWGLCEMNPERVGKFSNRYPGVRTTPSFDEVLADPGVDAVSIATPPSTHFGLVEQALTAGKHVLVEKPLATNAVDAESLLELARSNGLVLMPGHTFLYSPAVNKVRALITSGELGEVYFITSSRMNLGIYQPDGVVNDLAPHDLSILLYWLDRPVASVAASGSTVFQNGVPETAFLTLCFDEGPTANVQLSWLAPHKVRQMIVVGSKRMVVYDDAATDGAIRVYDRGFDFSEPATFGEYQLTYRSGDMVAPRLDAAEPLGLELQDFANAIRTGDAPRSHARLGVEIVRVLEAAHESLTSSGAPVDLTRNGDGPDSRRRANGHAPASAARSATQGTRDFTIAQAVSRLRPGHAPA
ncbi:MAG TPA: Gfo/Idh/MocA family oxidoreductase [Thermoleophilaceae bacterium]|jgi:predicted dehydrogenase